MWPNDKGQRPEPAAKDVRLASDSLGWLRFRSTGWLYDVLDRKYRPPHARNASRLQKATERPSQRNGGKGIWRVYFPASPLTPYQ